MISEHTHDENLMEDSALKALYRRHLPGHYRTHEIGEEVKATCGGIGEDESPRYPAAIEYHPEQQN